MSGDVHTQKLSWKGFYEMNDQMHPQLIKEFTISPNDGVIIGKGEDSKGTYQVGGKVSLQKVSKKDSSGAEVVVNK